jgi:hypothetical protein
MTKKSIDPTTIKLGTRVRHAEDGAEGRIAWANAQAVKIQWDDGEKVTWKRAELAAKGLELLDADQAPEPPPVKDPVPAAEPAPIPEFPVVRGEGGTVTVTVPPKDDPAFGPEQPVATPAEAPPAEPAVSPEPAKKSRPRAAKPDASSPTRPSALDAAAKVLAEEGRPMGCPELIGAMAAKGYWTSPGGKTPAATLYSAILRELQTKGDQARFVKVGKGMFALRPQA